MRKRACCHLLLLAVSAGVWGCASRPTSDASHGQSLAHGPTLATSGAQPDKPIAYVQGRTVRLADLMPTLIEAAGGSTLAQWVLTEQLRDALEHQGIDVTEAHLQAERTLLMATLDPDDPDRAARLLKALRDRRGLGPGRFDNLLWRNAALRLLVEDQVVVSPAAIQQAYELAHGPRCQVRILVAQSLAQANALRQRALGGESFSDLAAEHSTDLSAAQGGLLSPISPVDATYPRVVRDAMTQVQVGQVSDVFVLDQGYGLLKLERKIPATGVDLSDVRDTLTQQVRRQGQRLLMQQKARALLSQADVVVLDPTLGESWRQQKDRIELPVASEDGP